jgi:hypothetical protein
MKKTNLITSVAVLATLGLVGCGSGTENSENSISTGTSPSTTTVSISGTAIDPELIGTTVCLDINQDKQCTEEEPSTITDKNGNFSLNISSSQLEGNAPLLAIGGVDKESGEAFKGKLIADVESTPQNITPLTTLAYGKTEEELTKVENILGLSHEEIQANMITLANDGNMTSLKVSLALQKSAEAISPEDTLSFYKTLSQEIKTSNTADTLSDLIVNITPESLKADVNTLLEDITESHLSEPYALAEEARMEAKALGIDHEEMIEEIRNGNSTVPHTEDIEEELGEIHDKNSTSSPNEEEIPGDGNIPSMPQNP